MPPAIQYAAIMFAAGVRIPVPAALNSALGTRIGSPIAAGAVLFVVAFGASVLLVPATGAIRALPLVPGRLGHLFPAAVRVALYVPSVTWIAPRFGFGNAIFLVRLGQIVAAVVIGQFGPCGSRVAPLNAARVAGVALMALGCCRRGGSEAFSAGSSRAMRRCRARVAW